LNIFRPIFDILKNGGFFLSFWLGDFLPSVRTKEKFLEELCDIILVNMVTKEQVEVDLLDIFVSLNRGLNISDVTFQINNLYAPKGEQATPEILLEVLNELTEKGYLRKFQVGTIDSWKITEEGEDYFYSL
jgi:hypothetical protein